MKTTKIDKILREKLGEKEFTSVLSMCEQCGVCSGICPLSRHTDFRVRKIMLRAGLGNRESIESPDIWLCMMCYACLERCRAKLDIPDIISVLRTLAADEGRVPDSSLKVARLFLKTGHAFPISGLTRKLRKELGLREVRVDQRMVEEIQNLAERTGFSKMLEGR